MEITLLHSLAYTTKGDVPVSVVAKSLLANERLIQESIRLLESIDSDIKISSVKVKIRKLTNESPLKETLAVAIFLSYQNELEKAVPELITQLTGYTVATGPQTTMVTVLVMMVAAYIVDATVERVFPGKSVKALKEEYERMSGIAAKMLHVSKEEIDAAVKSRFENGRGKTLIQRAMDFFLPAKIESDAAITSDGEASIGREAINEIPSNIDYAILEQKISYEIEAARIEIHRSDIDENKHGWRAVINEVSNKKVRMELDTGISPEDLFGIRNLIGDVTVVQEMQAEGEYEIKAYHLTNVRSKDANTENS